MRSFMVLGVVVWILIVAWLARLGMGLDHIRRDQVPIMLVCGPIGGLSGWFFVSRLAKETTAAQKGD